MTEPDDSHDLEALRKRLKAVRVRLAALPVSNSSASGPADPSTGESWHRGNVLGHMNEMLIYWHSQLKGAAEGSEFVGRDEAGAEQRRQGIDRGQADREADLRRGVDVGIGSFLELMETWSPKDLERTVNFHSRGVERQAGVGELLQMLIVGHVEEHVTQLAELG